MSLPVFDKIVKPAEQILENRRVERVIDMLAFPTVLHQISLVLKVFKWCDTLGFCISKCEAISPAVKSPVRNKDKIFRRVGSAIALNASLNDKGDPTL
ncbi:hypothetical protein DI43_10785 [Geobacillus sp. CAMR12739]|nr:hypothetical protein DI43_10785 [Geobacillus sp. CAMR12739]